MTRDDVRDTDAASPGLGDSQLPPPGTPMDQLDRYYDRLRRRIAEPLAGKIGTPLADTLLLAPDLFVLLVRLFTDREVPGSSRSLVGGALVYFLLPADLLPEVLLGPGGFLDDVVLAAAVVTHVFSNEMRPFVERHWSGRGNVHEVLQDAVRAGEALLPARLYERLGRVLARRGVDLGSAARRADYADSATTDDETYDYSRVT